MSLPVIFKGKGEEHSDNLTYASVLRENLVCAVITLDSRKTIVAFSPEAERLTGVSANKIIGQTSAKLPVVLRKIVADVFATGEAIADRQIKLSGGGEDHVVRIQTFVTIAAKRKISHLNLVLHDLTAVRRLDQNLRRLDRLANIGTLSAGMAHEVKNALVAVRTFVDLLLEKNHDAELAEIVGREMKRIDAIVSQMLRVAGPPKPNIARVKMHQALDHSLRLVQHQINDKLIALHRSFAASPDVIHGDLYQLEQVFMNLFLNALESMGPNGELTVSTDIITPAGKHPPHFRLTIQDTGIGISPENMKRLFDTFFTTKKNGTGLGLSIARRIVEEHHGVISAVSEPNKGAAFIMLLPLAN